MTKTGWIGEEPDAAGPALPVTNLMLSMRQRGLGDVLENALKAVGALLEGLRK